MIHLGENVVDMAFIDSAVVQLPLSVKCFLQYDADIGIIMPLLSFVSDTSNLSLIDLALIVKYILACPRHS